MKLDDPFLSALLETSTDCSEQQSYAIYFQETQNVLFNSVSHEEVTIYSQQLKLNIENLLSL